MFILQSKSLYKWNTYLWSPSLGVFYCRFTLLPLCDTLSYYELHPHTKANMDVEKLDQSQMAERWISGITKVALHTVLSVYRFLLL